MNDDDYREVARIYQQAVDEGKRNPTAIVATHLFVSRPTAARYVAKARELGFLKPYGRKEKGDG
jgi:hypothetical protein